MSSKSKIPLNVEDFFYFGDASSYRDETCDKCQGKIPKDTRYKSNAAWKRIHHVNLCQSCFENREAYIEEKMKEISQKIQDQDAFLVDCVVFVSIQNCDEMGRAKILGKLNQLRKKIDFPFQSHESQVYINGRCSKEVNRISFHVKDAKDFVKKFGEINRVRTTCGCGLFVGDGCIPEAFGRKDSNVQDIEFNLLVM